MSETGMRPEDVCRARREYVNLEYGYLFNPYGKTKAAKRKVPLSDKAAAVLSKRLADVKGEYLFPGRGVGDAPILKVNNAHTATLRRPGVRQFRLYDLRHTCATLLLIAEENPKVVSERLGHSTIVLTLDTYSHVLPTMQQSATARLERLLYQKSHGKGTVQKKARS
jgi:integrase